MLPISPAWFACVPPDDSAFVLEPGTAPPTGSTLLVVGSGCPGTMRTMGRELVGRFPGSPVCLVADFATWCALGTGTRVVQEPGPPSMASIAAMKLDARTIHRALLAVDALPPVPESVLGREAALRLGCPSAAPLIERALQWRAAPRSEGYGRTLRRALRRHTPFGRLEWSWLGALACRPRVGRSVEALASEHGVGARVLRRWVRRLLGIEARVYATRPGWGWVLDQALRQAGCPALPLRALPATGGPAGTSAHHHPGPGPWRPPAAIHAGAGAIVPSSAAPN